VANKIITTATQTCKHQLKIAANAANGGQPKFCTSSTTLKTDKYCKRL